MGINVERPNKLQDPKEQADTLDKALATVERGVNSLGCQLLLPTKTDTVLKTTTSATFSIIPGYSFSIQSSGGAVTIEANISCNNSAGVESGVCLFIDGKPVQSRRIFINANYNASATFKYSAVLESGSHSIDFRYRTSSATLSVNFQNIFTDFIPSSEVTIYEMAVP